MKKKDVIAAMCKINALAYNSIGDFDSPSDCFCSQSTKSTDFQYSGKMLEFIEQAVREKLLKEGFTICE